MPDRRLEPIECPRCLGEGVDRQGRDCRRCGGLGVILPVGDDMEADE